MPAPVKKPVARRDRARATRARILDAAHALFVERGYFATTMADVAAAAGVAVQTVYFTFHTKAALLQAALDRAVLGDDPVPPQAQPWWAAMVAEPDPAAALRIMVDGSTDIFERVSALHVVALSVTTDEEVVAGLAHSERLRRDGYSEVVADVARRGALRPGLTTERATDLMFVLHAPVTHHAFRHGCGWTRAEWVDWSATTLAAQLLAPAGQPRPRTPRSRRTASA